MAEDHKSENTESGNKWVRFAYMLLFLFFYSIAEVVVGAIVFVQFLFVLITNRPNEALKVFGGEMALYIKEIIGYVTYGHNRKVYPFEPWIKAA